MYVHRIWLKSKIYG